MTAFSFVHAADLHLDAPFRGIGGGLLATALSAPASPSQERLAALLREATFIALDRLVDCCIREKADFLLLAGDVYNSADSSLRARLALRDAFLRLGRESIAVFLVHGNHDPLPGPESDQASIPWPDNVTVFGDSVSVHPAFRSFDGPREPIALIHGVSHPGAKESRNLARLFNRKPPSLLEPDLFQIGLLHCALAGCSGSHDNYAPCAFADLAEAGLDYWALGHVHGCRVAAADGKLLSAPEAVDFPALAAYSGSVQGLHVNESGPHGCLLVRVRDSRASASLVPLAPVQWEHVVVEPGPECDTLPVLETLILERVAALAPALPDPHARLPEAVLTRVTLQGRTPLDALLRKQDSLRDLHAHLSAELAGANVHIRDILPATRPAFDPESLLQRTDLAGEILRTTRQLGADPASLAVAAGRAVDPFFHRPKVKKAVAPPTEEELAALAAEAAFLCLDLLGAGREEQEDPQPEAGR